MEHFISFFLKFKSNLLVKRVLFLLNEAFAMVILYHAALFNEDNLLSCLSS